MPKIFLLVFTLIFIGCKEIPSVQNQGIDRELIPYVRELNEMSVFYVGRDLPLDGFTIRFKKLAYEDKAVCHTFSKEIFINPTHWNPFDPDAQEYERLALLLHQMGHCLFNKMDDPDPFNPDIEDRPKSIMTPEAIDEDYFKNNMEHYIRSVWI